jgi:FtsZ-interacting cell division protein YlmF
MVVRMMMMMEEGEGEEENEEKVEKVNREEEENKEAQKKNKENKEEEEEEQKNKNKKKKKGRINPGRLYFAQWRICGPSVWKLLHVTLLDPRICKSLSQFSKCVHPRPTILNCHYISL